MAVSTKYGKLDIGNLGDDEPVFILRARDDIALLTILDYRSRAASEEFESVVASVDEEIAAFNAWREENGTKAPGGYKTRAEREAEAEGTGVSTAPQETSE